MPNNDPILLQLDQELRSAVEKYLNNLSDLEKGELNIIPFVPSIPNTKEKITDYIEGSIYLYEANSKEEKEELKQELIEGHLQQVLNIDESLPLLDFQKEMYERLCSMSNQELLKIGVFGVPLSHQEAMTFKEMIIKDRIQCIKEAAILEIAESINIPNWKMEDRHKLIQQLFPKEVERAKACYFNKNLIDCFKGSLN